MTELPPEIRDALEPREGVRGGGENIPNAAQMLASAQHKHLTQVEQMARFKRVEKIRLETEPAYALRHTLLELGRVAANFSVTAESLEEMQRLLDEAKKKFDEVNNG